MFFQTLFTTSLLTTSLIAASSAAVLPRAPSELSSSTTFRLSINVTRFDPTPSLQGQHIGYSSSSPCLADLIVVPDPSAAAVFYQTTTTTVNLAHNDSGLVVSPGGTATVPSLNTVQLRCGPGTPGVAVAGSGALQYAGGEWMACPRDETGDVVLRFRQPGQRTLAGCADVQLLPVCEAAELPPPQDAVETACYTGL
ncbi:hypothetical protein F4775DRAFT_549667 [Biscogniauxia sp. FL1348]|nr:hypothetical protein F4775DRAFT_549667 [Biscogniauxia sp. FL1348]